MDCLCRRQLARDIDVCQYRCMSKSSDSAAHARPSRSPAARPCSSEPLGADEAARIAPLLKALADPVRLRLLSLVASYADQRGMCLRPQRRLRPLAADDQPPPQGAARGRPARPEQARRLGLLPGARRGPGRPERAARRRDGVTPAPLARRAVAELVGTAFLVMAVVGSGIAAPAAQPGRRRPPAAREQPGHRCRAGRADPRAAAGVRVVQPGGDAGRARARDARHRDGRGPGRGPGRGRRRSAPSSPT